MSWGECYISYWEIVLENYKEVYSAQTLDTNFQVGRKCYTE